MAITLFAAKSVNTLLWSGWCHWAPNAGFWSFYGTAKAKRNTGAFRASSVTLRRLLKIPPKNSPTVEAEAFVILTLRKHTRTHTVDRRLLDDEIIAYSDAPKTTTTARFVVYSWAVFVSSRARDSTSVFRALPTATFTYWLAPGRLHENINGVINLRRGSSWSREPGVRDVRDLQEEQIFPRGTWEDILAVKLTIVAMPWKTSIRHRLLDLRQFFPQSHFCAR